MKKTASLKLWMICFLGLALTQSACLRISRTRVIPDAERLLPAQTKTRAELLQMLDAASQSVRTLTGKVQLDVAGGGLKTGVLTEYRQTTGFVLVQRPDNIRIKAQAPLALATVLDMVSDAKKYCVSIPVKNKFACGATNAPATSENPMLNLRPNHVMAALFVDIRPYKNNSHLSVLEETVVGQRSYYTFQFVAVSAGQDAQLVEKIWIDRSLMQISRKQMFGKDGKVQTDVQFSDYQPVGAISFPKVISIQRPVEDYSLTMTFETTVLNEALAANAFELERPAGSELVQLDPVPSN